MNTTLNQLTFSNYYVEKEGAELDKLLKKYDSIKFWALGAVGVLATIAVGIMLSLSLVVNFL